MAKRTALTPSSCARARAAFRAVLPAAEKLALCRVLSPGRPAVRLSTFSWPRLWAAMLTSNALLPAVVLYTYLQPEVRVPTQRRAAGSCSVECMYVYIPPAAAVSMPV